MRSKGPNNAVCWVGQTPPPTGRLPAPWIRPCCGVQHACAILRAWNPSPRSLPIPFRQARLGTQPVISHHGVPTQIGRTRNTVFHLRARCSTRQIQTVRNGTVFSEKNGRRPRPTLVGRSRRPGRVTMAARQCPSGEVDMAARKLRRGVSIVGSAVSRFGAFPDKSSRDLMADAYSEAVEVGRQGLRPRGHRGALRRQLHGGPVRGAVAPGTRDRGPPRPDAAPGDAGGGRVRQQQPGVSAGRHGHRLRPPRHRDGRRGGEDDRRLRGGSAVAPRRGRRRGDGGRPGRLHLPRVLRGDGLGLHGPLRGDARALHARGHQEPRERRPQPQGPVQRVASGHHGPTRQARRRARRAGARSGATRSTSSATRRPTRWSRGRCACSTAPR